MSLNERFSDPVDTNRAVFFYCCRSLSGNGVSGICDGNLIPNIEYASNFRLNTSRLRELKSPDSANLMRSYTFARSSIAMTKRRMNQVIVRSANKRLPAVLPDGATHRSRIFVA